MIPQIQGFNQKGRLYKLDQKCKRFNRLKNKLIKILKKIFRENNRVNLKKSCFKVHLKITVIYESEIMSDKSISVF